MGAGSAGNATQRATERAQLHGDVAAACYLLERVRLRVAELERVRRGELAGVLGGVLKAIEAADAAGAP